jgi:UDP-N-acetylglucosamine--N-acetylmuramyl-(pentapeptide) pyrophosphoryl-undecaprenol N-acetylglucosamine transferase
VGANAGSGSGGRTLLVASTGGHLEQLMRLHERLQPAANETDWVTSDDPQSRSLLSGQRVHHLRYVAPRRGDVVLANLPEAARILRKGHYGRVVTTGSAMALSVLLAARLRGIPCHWIESSARADGPSLTGRIASLIPGMHLYAQYPSWAVGRWKYRGSVFDDYSAARRQPASSERARNVVVTFGTMRTYGFRRAVEAILRALPAVVTPDAHVLWQVGVTDVSDLEIETENAVPAASLKTAIAAADLVIAHAGVGSALTALDQGRAPLLLTRRKIHGEMVDDHQLMIADELATRGLAVSRAPEDLTDVDLHWAMGNRVSAAAAKSSFVLIE